MNTSRAIRLALNQILILTDTFGLEDLSGGNGGMVALALSRWLYERDIQAEIHLLIQDRFAPGEATSLELIRERE